MKKHRGLLGLLIVAIIWGSGFIANNIALKTMSPTEILCFRFLVAAVLMGIISFPKLKSVNKKGLLAGALLGIILYVSFYLQTVGLKHTTPSKNAFLTATNVVFVPFIALLMARKKIDGFSVLGAVFALVGIGVLSLNGNMRLSYGDFLTLLCAVGFAFHIYLTGEFVQKHDFMILTAMQMISAFLISFVVLLLTEKVPIHFESSGMLSVLYLGIFSTTIAFFLQTLAQRYTEETTAAVILSLESVFGTLFSVLIVHENITTRMVLGCMMILAGVLIAETKLTWFFNKKTRSSFKFH